MAVNICRKYFQFIPEANETSAAGGLLLMNAGGENFSARSPEDMLKLESAAGIGLPEYFEIADCYRRNAMKELCMIIREMVKPIMYYGNA